MNLTNIPFNQFICIISFLFSICHSIQAQKEADMSSAFDLTALLIHFETNKQITFSYDAHSIKHIRLQFNKSGLSIGEIDFDQFLSAIREQTLFDIKQKGSSYLLYMANKPIVISGTVINLYTEKELPEVLITDSNTSVFTDAMGNFTIKTKAFNTLDFYFSGYKSKRMSVRSILGTNSVLVAMQELTEQLDEVLLIQDYLTFGVDKNRDGSVSVSPKKMGTLPGLIEPDIMQGIQLLPGINSSFEGVQEVSIRGSAPDHNLILWEGIKLYNMGHFFDKLPALNPYIIDNAKIYRSGTSTRYGGRVAGVIDINSISNIPQRTKINAGINLTTYDANITFPVTKKIGVMLSGRHSVNGFIPSTKVKLLEEQVLQNTIFFPPEEFLSSVSITNSNKFYDFASKLIWDLSENSTLIANGILINNQLNAELTMNETNLRDFWKISSENIGSSIKWEYAPKENLSFLTLAQFSMFRSFFNENLVFDDGNQIQTQENNILDLGSKIEMDYKPNINSNVLLGYEYTYNSLIHKESFLKFFDFDTKLNSHAIYGEYMKQKPAFNYRAGMRSMYYSEIDKVFLEPRLFININLSNKVSVNASAEIKSQVVRKDTKDPDLGNSSLTRSINENIWLISGKESSFDFDNEAILTVQQGTLGVSYQSKGFHIDVESFYKKGGGIVSIAPDFNEVNEGFFTGSFRSYGLDILVKQKIGKYRTWLGYSLGESILDFPELIANSFLSSNNHTHILNWSHTLQLNNFEIGISWNYRTGNLYSIPSDAIEAGEDFFTLNYTSFNNFKLPDYQRLNTSLFYTIPLLKEKDRTLKIGVAIQNILNQRNYTSRHHETLPSGVDANFQVPINGTNQQVGVLQKDFFGSPFNLDAVVRVNF